MVVEVTFLGTSSAKPTARRNMSALALRFEDGETWLFDCGEATQHRIAASRTVRVTRITRIFISHLHGDHLFGLPGLLCTLAGGRSEEDPGPPLHIYGPVGVAAYLRATLGLSYSVVPFQLIVHELAVTLHENSDVDPQTSEAVNRALGADAVAERTGFVRASAAPLAPGRLPCDAHTGRSVSFTPVPHRAPCVAYIVSVEGAQRTLDPAAAMARGVPKGPLFGELKKGRSVVLEDGSTVHPDQVCHPGPDPLRIAISGDTSDATTISKACIGGTPIDLFITECTFGSDVSDEDAALRGHCNTALAANAINIMRPRILTVLTHFSSRYTTEQIEAMAASCPEKTIAAEDFMVVQVSFDRTFSVWRNQVTTSHAHAAAEIAGSA